MENRELRFCVPERIKNLSGMKSTLEFVGVHRLVAAVREWTEEIMSNFTFELNDEITRESVFISLSNMMDILHEKNAVYDFKVICDETNNTPNDVDAGILRAQVLFKMNKVDEWIWIKSSIIPNASFSDEAGINRWYDEKNDFEQRFDNAMKGV